MNLTEFDVILLNSSAGKDSQAMIDVVTKMAKAQGVKDRVQVVHAILEEEWEGTKELAQEQAEAYGLPIHFVKRSQGSLLEQVEKRRMWPSSTARYCTSDHKRDQVSRIITTLAKQAQNNGNRPRILNCMGLRAAESPSRAKKNPFEIDRRNTNSRREVWTWLPIFNLMTDDVWTIIRESGVRHHWAYDAGMPRLSCCFCIFAPRAALVRAGHLNPKLLERYAEVEQKIGHQFTQKISMVEIKNAVAAGEQPGEICTWEM
ncbi:MAG: phosphoadenosine phosphosulfate reductase family protein [Acidobacteriota bacterium]